MTMTDNDEAGKLFVGGLSWETTKEVLQSYFSKFGEVVDSVVMKNNETGRSRGFGFVTFKDPSCVSIVLQTKPHELNGRTIDAKECTPRSLQKNRRGPNPGKVFLGGLPPDITETDIRSALSEYGKVTQVSIMCDQETKKCRGFGFLSFESEESIDKACAERFVIINGKQVECKRAEPRDNSRRNQQFGGGSQNGGPSGPYGGGSNYQENWNQAPQNFGMQGGNAYQPYGSPAATPYGQSAMPFNATPTPQYQQQQPYGNFGAGGYGYPQAAAPAGSNWNAAPTPGATAGYGQQPAISSYSPGSAPGYPQAPGMSNDAQPGAGSYGAPNAYQQGNSSYGPSKSYGGGYPKQNAGNGGGGYNNNQNSAGRGQNYHPYRR